MLTYAQALLELYPKTKIFSADNNNNNIVKVIVSYVRIAL